MDFNSYAAPEQTNVTPTQLARICMGVATGRYETVNVMRNLHMLGLNIPGLPEDPQDQGVFLRTRGNALRREALALSIDLHTVFKVCDDLFIELYHLAEEEPFWRDTFTTTNVTFAIQHIMGDVADVTVKMKSGKYTIGCLSLMQEEPLYPDLNLYRLGRSLETANHTAISQSFLLEDMERQHARLKDIPDNELGWYTVSVNKGLHLTPDGAKFKRQQEQHGQQGVVDAEQEPVTELEAEAIENQKDNYNLGA